MKRFALLIVGAALAAAPMAQAAHDTPDGADCRSGSAAPVTAASGGQADRGAACVNAGGTTVFYIGGEVQPENPDNAGTGGACGAIIVADNTIAGEDDWDNNGADGQAGTADDEDCE